MCERVEVRGARRIVMSLALGALLLSGLPAPSAAAPVDVCAPACTVLAGPVVFAPPTTVVVSGSTVTWTTPADTTAHTATADSLCFHTQFPVGASGSARFRIEEGVLYAKVPLKAEAACTDALPLGPDAFLLRYVCLFHLPMVGELVVVNA